MRHKRLVITAVSLLLIVFCCGFATAEIYDFGGATDNGVYSGTLAVDNSGNVAFTVAAATGPGADVQVAAQYSDDTGGAAAGQETRAVGDSAFIGSGAASSNGDTASTGAHAIGNADIDTLQAAQAGQGGVPGFATVDGTLAIQDTRILGETAAAGSLGVSHAGYEAHTNTHASGFGAIGTFQGAGAGDVNFLGIDVAGAVAGQESAIDSENGGSASSMATGGGNSAETQLSFPTDGIALTGQVAAAGQVEIPGLVTGHGAVAGQDSQFASINGGSASSTAAGGGNTATTELSFSGSGAAGTLQVAAAGQVGVPGFASVDGAVAGQGSIIESENGGTFSSSASNGNGEEAETWAESNGLGVIDMVQVAAAGQVELASGPADLTVDGAVAGQTGNIVSIGLSSEHSGTAGTYARNGNGDAAASRAYYDGTGYLSGGQVAAIGDVEGTLFSTPFNAGGALAIQDVVVLGTNEGYAVSLTYTGTGDQVVTYSDFWGNGQLSTMQGAATAEIEVLGMVSADGAAAGQISYIESDQAGHAYSFAGTGGDLTTTAISEASYEIEGGLLITAQGAATGQVDAPGFASVDGAVAGQFTRIDPDGTGTGNAATFAQTGNFYDLVEVSTTSVGGNPIDLVGQGAAAGRISVPGTFNAEGAAAIQRSSNAMVATAMHGATSDPDFAPGGSTQYAVAGSATGFGTGAVAWH